MLPKILFLIPHGSATPHIYNVRRSKYIIFSIYNTLIYGYMNELPNKIHKHKIYPNYFSVTNMDVFDELNDTEMLQILSKLSDELSDELKDETQYEPTNDFTSISIYTDDIAIQGYRPPMPSIELFSIPPKTSKEARYIWKKADIPQSASIDVLNRKLLRWAKNYTDFTMINGEITAIKWTNKSGHTTIESKWSTFIKWMLCASTTHQGQR